MVISLSSTFVAGTVSVFEEACGLCPQADTWPDTWVDNQPCTYSSVGLIYLSDHVFDILSIYTTRH